MLSYIIEFLGTMILITLGDGIVANVTLNRSGAKGAGSIQVTFARGLTVMLSTLAFGAASGAHFNSALTATLTVDGSMAWGLVSRYIVVRFAGAFVGAVTVYLLLKDQYDATESAATKLEAFCAKPSVPNMGRNILNKTVGTFILVFVIKDIGQITSIVPDVDKLLILGIVVSIDMSLGDLIGYAINPACDLGPYLVHAVLPIKGRGDSSWGYVLVVIIEPAVGAVAIVLLHWAILWM